MVIARRGAVRSESAHRAILHAAASQIEAVGYDRITIEGIAGEAGVAKQTIYRWYKTKSAIVAECLIEGYLLGDSFDAPSTGDLNADLVTWLDHVFQYLAVDDHATLVRSLLAAAIETSDISDQLAERLGAKTPSIANRLAQAKAQGELAESASPQLIGEAIFGVIVIRIIGKGEFQHADAADLVNTLLGPALSSSDARTSRGDSN